MVQWILVKIIALKLRNYDRVGDDDLAIMWLIMNQVKVNCCLIGCILSSIGVHNAESQVISPKVAKGFLLRVGHHM